ncbi:dihydroorotase [Muribaculaceae bacterium Isolate-114 (HZI)]|nr:dihydroorotase [Muribaculaceae bacterium Isolate-114 (HZI)]
MEKILIKNALLSPSGKEGTVDILIYEGKIGKIAPQVDSPHDCSVIDADGLTVIPGLVDVHVHLREPGFSYKETIAAGTAAAAAGGFTTVCPMPNLNPAPDSPENLERQLEIIRRDAKIETIPYATITRSRLGAELVDYEALAPFVAGFSDDGSGVQDEEVMREAMRQIAKTGKILAAHCEVNSLLRGGYIHDGEYARAHGHRGICSESEWQEIERDIRLAGETGCRLHICHISTAESVDLIRRAKERGVRVTCETAPHYLAFCDEDMREEGRFKMNPPIRSRRDMEALREGAADGTIDVIATDHAPHSAEEKSKGLEKSAMGVVGLETSLAAVYTHMVRPGHISFPRMLEMMALEPRKLFGFKGGLVPGNRADLAIVDFDRVVKVDSTSFLSKGKSTPFDGTTLFGKVMMTIAGGKTVYKL